MANSRKHTSDSSVNRSNLVVTRTLRVKTGEPPFRSPTPETCLRVVVGASELDPASYGPNTEIRGMLDAVFVMRDESVFGTLERQYMSTLRASTRHFDTFASTLISAVLFVIWISESDNYWRDIFIRDTKYRSSSVRIFQLFSPRDRIGIYKAWYINIAVCIFEFYI